MKNEKIGVIGSGLIGRSWAMLFAAAGYNVHMYDVDKEQVKRALEDVAKQLGVLQDTGMLRGDLSAEDQFKLIKGCSTLDDVVKGSKHVQECVPEDLDLKRKIFQQMDKVADASVILCSSTSTFVPSKFTENLKHRKQIIVGHPVNPPYYVPLVEIIPAPWTDPSVVQATTKLMGEIGQTPVTLNKEIEGFILNRLQYSMTTEAWHLVADGVVSVKGIDAVMSEGLGMRYAFLGPFETAHLNAEGWSSYCQRYSEAIQNVTKISGPSVKFEGTQVDRIAKDLCEMTPLEKLQETRSWRDSCLISLSQLKKKVSKQKPGKT